MSNLRELCIWYLYLDCIFVQTILLSNLRELCSSGLIVVLDQCFATTMQQINRREREIDHLLDLCLRCSPALSPARSPARPPARSPARSPPLSPARSPARKSGARWPAGSAPGSVVTGDGPSAHISIV